jgi:hypothetical protein
MAMNDITMVNTTIDIMASSISKDLMGDVVNDLGISVV